MGRNSVDEGNEIAKELAGMSQEVKQVLVHTDGACLGNPGPGGWAALLQCQGHEREISGGQADTTNNRMELMAAICALEALGKPCHVIIVTDSQYVRQGITQWMSGWIKKGWRTSAGKPVKNQDLWERLNTAAVKHTIDWRWVKGHSGHPENERVDQLAQSQAYKFR